MIATETVKFDANGLIPAIIQDSKSLKVLMLGYMSTESLEITIATKKVTFWSRSRNELWVKGETSGNFLNLVSLSLDCDSDAILVTVEPVGATCHTGSESCFDVGDN